LIIKKPQKLIENHQKQVLKPKKSSLFNRNITNNRYLLYPPLEKEQWKEKRNRRKFEKEVWKLSLKIKNSFYGFLNFITLAG